LFCLFFIKKPFAYCIIPFQVIHSPILGFLGAAF
jgi:hypothetical protein